MFLSILFYRIIKKNTLILIRLNGALANYVKMQYLTTSINMVSGFHGFSIAYTIPSGYELVSVKVEDSGTQGNCVISFHGYNDGNLQFSYQADNSRASLYISVIVLLLKS